MKESFRSQKSREEVLDRTVSHRLTMYQLESYDLPPETTNYFSVESIDSSGKRDGVTSPIKSFTTR